MITINKLKSLSILIILLASFGLTINCSAQNTEDTLNTKQQCIIPISAFTAKGDMLQLDSALNDGLDAGLSINEIKETRSAFKLQVILCY